MTKVWKEGLVGGGVPGARHDFLVSFSEDRVHPAHPRITIGTIYCTIYCTVLYIIQSLLRHLAACHHHSNATFYSLSIRSQHANRSFFRPHLFTNVFQSIFPAGIFTVENFVC